MSAENAAEAAIVQDEESGLLIAKVNGKYFKFHGAADIPPGAEDGPHSLEALEQMTKEKLGELYGAIVKVPTKNFKTKEVALDSIAYQVARLPEYDPNPQPKPAPKESGSPGTRVRRERATAEVFELLSAESPADAIKKMAPQAKELVSILLDFAKEKGATKFPASEFISFLEKPEVAKRLNTRQPPSRILQYYRSTLVGAKLLVVT